MAALNTHSRKLRDLGLVLIKCIALERQIRALKVAALKRLKDQINELKATKVKESDSLMEVCILQTRDRLVIVANIRTAVYTRTKMINAR